MGNKGLFPQKGERSEPRSRTAPKGCRGPLLASIDDNFAVRNSPLAGPDAPTPARIGTGRPMGRSIASEGDPKGVQGGERKAPSAPAGAYPCPGGLDAPTPAREQGLQPYGALTLFFRWRKKSVQKKASGTATPGKSPLLPILTAGLAMSRAAELASLRMLSCALGARLFPPSKWAGLFPSAAYRRSAPPQLA